MSRAQRHAYRLRRRPELEEIPKKFTSPASVTNAEVEAELIQEEFETHFVKNFRREMKSLLKMNRVYDQNRQAKAANLTLDAGLRQGFYQPLAKVQSTRHDQYLVGSIPPIALRFPKSKEDIESMTRAEVVALIKFYALHVDVNGRGVAHLRDALHRWLTTCTDDDEEMEDDQDVEDVPAEQSMMVTDD